MKGNRIYYQRSRQGKRVRFSCSTGNWHQAAAIRDQYETRTELAALEPADPTVNMPEQWSSEAAVALRSAERRRSMVHRARHRAKKNGLPFSLHPDDLTIPRRCPVLGIELVTKFTSDANRDYWPSLDRIVPDLGYVRGNVIVMSYRANRIKSDATAAELCAIAVWVTHRTFGA